MRSTLTLSQPIAVPSGVLEIALAGDLDTATASTLLSAATDLVCSGCRILTLDMADLRFMDSSGLGALVDIRNIATQASVELVLQRPPRNVLRVLELTGMRDVFTIEGTAT